MARWGKQRCRTPDNDSRKLFPPCYSEYNNFIRFTLYQDEAAVLSQKSEAHGSSDEVKSYRKIHCSESIVGRLIWDNRRYERDPGLDPTQDESE